jgi:hypothetical protein
MIQTLEINAVGYDLRPGTAKDQRSEQQCEDSL